VATSIDSARPAAAVEIASLTWPIPFPLERTRLKLVGPLILLSEWFDENVVDYFTGTSELTLAALHDSDYQ